MKLDTRFAVAWLVLASGCSDDDEVPAESGAASRRDAGDCRSSSALGDELPGQDLEFGVLYGEHFADGPGNWCASGTRSSWACCVAQKESVPADDHHAWATGLRGTYASNEHSYLESPVLDLSAEDDDPLLAVDLAYDLDVNDEAYVELSLDGGDSWRVLGHAGSGSNWYGEGERWVGRSLVSISANERATRSWRCA
jgi:hypothetical protein